MPISEPPPTPSHLLRSHLTSIQALSISDDNERLYSGDASGTVTITSTRSLRPITSWKAHNDSLLGVQEWGKQIITHARDNKLHVWIRAVETAPAIRPGGAAAILETPTPTLRYSMDVNALNFCRFSLLQLSTISTTGDEGGASNAQEPRALIALPNLIDSEVADIWELPSQDRVHAAIGEREKAPRQADGSRNTTGVIMALHLFQVPTDTTPSQELRLVCAYEDGSVALRHYSGSKIKSVQGIGWEVLWKVKLHVETIMAMRVAKDNSFALTVSADHIVGKYDLSASPDGSRVPHRTKHPGNGCIAIRDDGKLCAIGGWDGKIRLYSTKSFKPLGTLSYHKQALHVIEFAHSLKGVRGENEQTAIPDDDDDAGDYEEMDMERRERWLIAGAKDNRISIWSLISFQKS